MTIYNFTLHLEGPAITKELADQIYGRIDDGTLSELNSAAKLSMARDAEHLEQAIRSSIADIASCGFTVKQVTIDTLNSWAEVQTSS